MGTSVQYRLGDLLEIKHGFAFKGEFFSSEGSLILLTPGNFKEDGGLKLKGEKEKYYTGSYPEEYLLKQGDMLIAMTDLIQNAPILGSPAWIPDNNRFLHNQRLGKVVNLKTDKALPEYLYYVFNTSAVRNQIKGSATGSTVRHTAPSRIYDITVDLPPVSVQLRIAGILSAYDDLIENSRRRIRILETIARSMYREWFVNFRFPGHEKVRRVPSALGEIPEGWEVTQLPDCIEINPRVTGPREGEKPFVPMGCLSNDSMLISDIESREGNSGAKFQNGDTLFARITPCLENGKTGFVQFLTDSEAVAVGSTEFIVLRSRTLTPEFVYLLARTDEFRGNAIKSMSGATGRQRVQERCLDQFQIAHPTPALLGVFRRVVQPSFKLIQQLHLQVHNLRRTRDLLLPRLLAGEIAPHVDDIDQKPLKTIPNSLGLSVTGSPKLPSRFSVQPFLANPDSAIRPSGVGRTSPIDDTDRTDVLCAIRTLFNDDKQRERDTTIRELAHALGYPRTGSHLYEVLSTELQTAVRRGIIVNVGGAYRRGFRTLADCTRESLKKDFESAIGRIWITRQDAIRALARWLGFARVGTVIDDTGRSLINGLIREGRLETDGPELIRRT